ncbi:hypothetical protein JL721_7449 [Aureococcus anophagefferens]|nr:hypothetical protein JL721_7449 [Aureococcus anophagefferens]
MKTGRVVGLRWLPQELLLEVLAFAPMRSYGRLAACSGFLERLVREHADWTACYATLRGGAPTTTTPAGDGVVERAAAPGTARSDPAAFEPPHSRPRAGLRPHGPRRPAAALRVVSQTLPGACRRGFAVTALAARHGARRGDETALLAVDAAGEAAIASWWSCDDRTAEDEVVGARGGGAARLPSWSPNWWRLFDTRARGRSNRVRFSELIWGEDAGYGVTAFTCGYDGLAGVFFYTSFSDERTRRRPVRPRAGIPPSREVRQVALGGGARLLTACYDGTASAWAVSGPPAPREVIADHRGHAVERIAVDGDAALASVDFTGCLKLSRLDEAKVAVRHLDVDGDAGSPTCVAAPSFDEPAAAVYLSAGRAPSAGVDAASFGRKTQLLGFAFALRPEPDLPKTRALALATGSLASLSVLALGHCDGTVSTVALPFAGPSFRKREAELRRKVPAGHVWDGARWVDAAAET